MEVQIKESKIIRPAKETPKHLLQNTELDFLVPSIHVPGVYFFRRPNDSSKFFEAGLLKEALSKVLVPYYPMAGRLGKDVNGKMEIHCNAEGALFMEAESSCVIDDFGDFESSSKLVQLVPKVDYTNDISSYPLLVIQVTHFKCGGVCLGIGLHHTLTDASSTFPFFNAWAEITRGVPISILPFLDRTVVSVGVPSSPKFEHIEYDPPPTMNVPSQKTDFQSNPKPISSAILNLSVDQLNKLKAKSMENHVLTTKYTRFEIITAHIWRCLCKARGLSNDQPSKLLIPVDGRTKLNPPLPTGYIGNLIFTGTSIALSGDIQSEPLNFTTQRIHKTLMKMNNEYLKSALAYLKQQPDLTVLKRGSHVYKCPNLNISNLFHMPIYDVDFGWGRPIFFRPILFVDGRIHILPSPNNDGSLYLVANLEAQHIELFKQLFYEI